MCIDIYIEYVQQEHIFAKVCIMRSFLDPKVIRYPLLMKRELLLLLLSPPFQYRQAVHTTTPQIPLRQSYNVHDR